MDITKESEELVKVVEARLASKARESLVQIVAQTSAEADVMILAGFGIDAKDFLLKTIITECEKLLQEG